jgi:hypothetical protein
MSRIHGGATSVSTAVIEAPEREPRISPPVLLFAPDRAMAAQARSGRVLWIFLFAWTCSILLGAALAYRVDARSATLKKLEQSGQLATMSERQIADETRSGERVSQVTSIAKGVVGVPLQLGLGCLSLLALSWFLQGRLKGSAVAPVATAALLPGALADLIDAVSAYRHALIPPDGVPLGPRTLSHIAAALGRPWSGPWAKLGEAFDLYSLWSAVLLGFGLAAAATLPKKRAVVGTLVAWLCFRLLTRVAAGG